MPLQIIRHDITGVACDVIVNPTDSFYSGSGGTDLAIHEGAGKELDEVCAGLPSLNYGEVKATEAFRLRSRYIIHTMGPVWKDGMHNEAALLRGCYINALMKAKRLQAKSVAFPLISSGTFGFPKDKVLRIAIDAIGDFLFSADSEILVYLCVRDRNAFELSRDIALREYVNRGRDFLYENHALKMEREHDAPSAAALWEKADADEQVCAPIPPCAAPAPKSSLGSEAREKALAKDSPMPVSLTEWIRMQDDTFAVLLLKLIDKKGIGGVECYKKANVTKNTFWKIRNDGKYRPSKPTVIAFAIALELTMEETELLLKSAGFALAHNNTFDMIIEFYIMNGIYDIFEINAALWQYDQVCLGV